MIDNKELIDQLHEILDTFCQNIANDGKQACHKDVMRLRSALIHASNTTRQLKVHRLFSGRSYNFLLNDVVPLIRYMIETINHETTTLETEMHGTQIFSDYEAQKLQQYAFKEEFKTALEKMLFFIRRERAELETNELQSEKSSDNDHHPIFPFK